jgi:hypothetical protein
VDRLSVAPDFSAAVLPTSSAYVIKVEQRQLRTHPIPEELMETPFLPVKSTLIALLVAVAFFMENSMAPSSPRAPQMASRSTSARLTNIGMTA